MTPVLILYPGETRRPVKLPSALSWTLLGRNMKLRVPQSIGLIMMSRLPHRLCSLVYHIFNHPAYGPLPW